MDTEKREATKKNNRRRNTIIAIIVIIIIIILLLRSCGGSTGTVTSIFTPDLDTNASDWNGNVDYGAAEADAAEEQTISIPGYPYIYIGAGQTTAYITLANPEGNPCYFTFEIWLSEPEELLYASKQIAPGQAISQETFLKTLSAGEYAATIKITTNSLTDGSPMNGANMETTLIVQ
jgi:hypothetical protein